jgi:hypothetical protein
MFKNLRASFAAIIHLAAYAESTKSKYLPCWHAIANSVKAGIAIYFAHENINKK